MSLKELKIKIFADGADLNGMVQLSKVGWVKGFTTNPTLMRKAGIVDYEKFAKEVLLAIPQLPISFEVFSDDFADMERQARKIASWGKSVYVKIPVTNTKGESSAPLIRKLAQDGLQLNVTAITTINQVREVSGALKAGVPGIISVFAGRIADTGVDPVPLMQECLRIAHAKPALELLWASSREVLNLLQAEAIGCDIITVTNDILKKASQQLGMDLGAMSLETVKMFDKDATSAGFKL